MISATLDRELASAAEEAHAAAEVARAPEAASLMLLAMRLDDVLEALREPDVPLPPPSIERVGALDLWRRDLRSGIGGQRLDRPSTWRIDPLYEAAQWEASAIEAEREGCLVTARRHMERAATIIAENADRLVRERAA